MGKNKTYKNKETRKFAWKLSNFITKRMASNNYATVRKKN